MPVINDLVQSTLGNSNYGYSAQRVTDLGATEYTLASIMVDKSSSVSDFESDLEKALVASISSLKYSPRSDNLMARIVTFNHNMDEVHGFKLLSNVNLQDYNGVIQTGGSTSLNDTAVNVLEATADYGNNLYNNQFTTNGIVIAITDGCDVGSKHTLNSVRDTLAKIKRSESLESIKTILIGINVQDAHVAKYLADWQQQAGFDQYIEIGKVTDKSLAKLQGFVSNSISAQSQALGTGGPSQSLTF